jgi:hypothetical protein
MDLGSRDEIEERLREMGIDDDVIQVETFLQSLPALDALTTARTDDREQFDVALELLIRFESYERKARSRRKKAIRELLV